jgi:hypothetical protein
VAASPFVECDCGRQTSPFGYGDPDAEDEVKLGSGQLEAPLVLACVVGDY